MLEWHRRNAPVLVVCASNFGLDVIAKRIAMELEKRNLPHHSNSTDGVYRLETEFNEDSETQFLSEGISETFSSNNNLQELYDPRITPTLLEFFKDWIKTRASSRNNLSFGRHIISRLEKAIWKARLGWKRGQMNFWSFS